MTASEAARLERNLPNTVSIFEAYPFTVVSMDFIKRNGASLTLSACPSMVVVDEAHSASVQVKDGKDAMSLSARCDDTERNILLLTQLHIQVMKPPFTISGSYWIKNSGLRDAGGERQRQLRERLQGTLSSAVVGHRCVEKAGTFQHETQLPLSSDG